MIELENLFKPGLREELDDFLHAITPPDVQEFIEISHYRLRSRDSLMALCEDNAKKPLIAVQLDCTSDALDFIAFYATVHHDLGLGINGSVRPDGKVYHGTFIHDTSRIGRFLNLKKLTDCSMELSHYPVDFSATSPLFDEGRILLVDPNSAFGKYVSTFMGHGRPKAREQLIYR